RFHQAYRRARNGIASGVEDVAMRPVEARELDMLELYQTSPAAKIIVEKAKKKIATVPPIAPMA
ncbi:MAG: hypothetical protein KC643_32275, partial [Nitrospira sp.]|nr:hypothetical protein [Nitrospira sp.]